MDGILILAHGSRRLETEETLNSLVRKVKNQTGLELVNQAYLQFSEQNLAVGIAQLVGQGATAIRVVPLFLFAGVHVTHDIPGELREIQARYPEIPIRLMGHLGDDDRIAAIIVDRIREALIP